MIERKDILSLEFLKKSPFTGSYKGMRYRIEKIEKEEQKMLQATLWKGPFCYEVTKEPKECKECAFTEEGICEIVEWLNTKWSTGQNQWE